MRAGNPRSTLLCVGANGTHAADREPDGDSSLVHCLSRWCLTGIPPAGINKTVTYPPGV
ncbi:hypothetical protein CITRIK5_70830 [Citricoccus sp. K5]|nr:hypothetical protein CITRIK5_70830 [Citricoccus sp. K5]